MNSVTVEPKQDCPPLLLIVKGLDAFEQRILQATVRLSAKRQPQLHLISEADREIVNVIIIDSRDAQAMSWAEKHSQWLAQKTVIWIDGEPENKKHASLKRPVLWVNLPIILSRILDDLSVVDSAEADKSFIFDRSNSANNERNVSLLGKSKLLVVDDSLAIRNYMSSVLERQGYSITTADSGEMALEVLRDKKFSCIFMDVIMPGIDGYETCRKIKAMPYGKKTPVIMLTGKGSPFDKIRGKMAGCSAYLTKPVDILKLKDALKKNL